MRPADPQERYDRVVGSGVLAPAVGHVAKGADHEYLLILQTPDFEQDTWVPMVAAPCAS